MNWKEIKSLIDIFCMGFALLIPFLETFCVLMYTWLVAFLNFPDQTVTIHVNEFGEAYPELIMWIVFFPICVYGIYLNFQYLAQKVFWHRYHIKKIL